MRLTLDKGLIQTLNCTFRSAQYNVWTISASSSLFEMNFFPFSIFHAAAATGLLAISLKYLRIESVQSSANVQLCRMNVFLCKRTASIYMENINNQMVINI